VRPIRTAAQTAATAPFGHKPRAERDELLGVTVLAAHTQRPVLEAAAFQVRLEFVLHVSRQRSAIGFGHGDELGVVPLDELVEQRRLGPVASVLEQNGHSLFMSPGRRWRQVVQGPDGSLYALTENAR
jgi:hypothetical protein